MHSHGTRHSLFMGAIMADAEKAPFAFEWNGKIITGSVTPIRHHFVDYEVDVTIDGVSFNFTMRQVSPGSNPHYSARMYTQTEAPDVRCYMDARGLAPDAFQAAILHIIAERFSDSTL